MNKKYEYSGGKTGIGPFALNNKNHVLTQLAKLNFADNPLLKVLGFKGLADINSRNEIVFKRDKYGNIEFNDQNKPILFEDQGIRILDWISAMINAHVDVAKDPYVIRLNVRQYTYNICNFLLRVGYGKSTFYFLPQQILKDMALAYEAASGNYGVKSDKSKTALINDEIYKIRKKYYDEYVKHSQNAKLNIELDQQEDGSIVFTDISKSINDVAVDVMNRDNLILSLQNSRLLDQLSEEQLTEYYKQQLLISELFLQLNTLSEDMSKMVQLSQIDTKKFGNNFVEQDRFVYRLKSLLANTQLFDKSDLWNYYKTTFLFTKLKNGLIYPATIFEPLLLRSRQSFKDSISKILSLTNRINTNDESLNKQISNELEGQLRWKFLIQKGIDTFDFVYGPNSMAIRLANLKTDILNGKYPELLTQDGKIANRLLNYLGSLSKMTTDKYEAPDIITRNRISDGDKYLKQTLSVYWEELYESTYPEIRRFALDLFYYQLATTGGNFTKNGIFNLTPISIIKDSGYNDFMRETVNNFIGDTNIDYDNFFLNNWKNNKIVKTITLYKDVFDQQTGTLDKALIFPVLFSKDNIDGINKPYPLIMMPNGNPIGKNYFKQDVYQPYIKVVLDRTSPAGTVLYKFIGSVTDKNGFKKPIYVVVNKKGLDDKGRVVKEYDNYSNSMFEFNNLPKALLAKKQITRNEIESVLNAGRSNDINRWRQLLSSLDIVDDYLPNTVAINIDLLDYNPQDDSNYTTYSEDVYEGTQKQKVNEGRIESSGNDKSTYEFNDGFTVDLPFKLNDQQVELLNTLQDFIDNPNKYDNSITISGYAGTGKTTMIGIFNKWLNHIGINPIFSSPTHRANAVTKMNNPNANVKTLHSIFGLSPIVDLENGVYDLRKLTSQQINSPKIKGNQLLIIDESSMVSDTLYKFIDEFKKNNSIQVIYVGDPAQLSPVKDKDISPVFRNNKSKVELTKVERTGDNPILFEATNLREGKDLSYTTNVINGEGVEYIPQNSQRIDDIINEIVDSNEYKNNPLYFRILSATNNMLDDANNKVRKQLFGDNAKQIEVGDILMGYDNVGRDENSIRNSIDYVVTSVSEEKKKSIKTLKSDIEVSGYEIQLKVASTNEKLPHKMFVLSNNISNADLQEIAYVNEELNRAINDAFRNHDYDLVNKYSQLYNAYKRSTLLMRNYEQNGALKLRKSIDYGYAHTIHKSQGGTYNKVMIYLDTVNVFDPKVQQQLKYVAVSRAKENVYIVTNHEIKEQPNVDINTEINNSQYILHSGGAIGSDTMWSNIGKEYGVISNHYYSGNKTPNGNIEISESDKTEGQQKVTIAARQMGRIEPNQQVRNELLIRDWAQVKYANSVFAITTMLSVGDEMNYGKKAKIRQGKGGTGYAMQMAINEGKPVYIYDQIRKQWYKNIDGKWSTSDIPVLTNNFAGIGTREINQDGIQAIKDVYNKTFQKISNKQDKEQQTVNILEQADFGSDESLFSSMRKEGKNIADICKGK